MKATIGQTVDWTLTVSTVDQRRVSFVSKDLGQVWNPKADGDCDAELMIFVLGPGEQSPTDGFWLQTGYANVGDSIDRDVAATLKRGDVVRIRGRVEKADSVGMGPLTCYFVIGSGSVARP